MPHPLTSQILLTLHFLVQFVGPLEEIVDLAPLFIALCVDHDPSLGFIREVMTDTRDREDDLLQCTVLAYHLWGRGSGCG